MRVTELIRRKRDGGELTGDELEHLIDRYTAGDIPDYQMSSFLMAVYFNSFSSDELATWTEAMLRSGDVIDMSDVPGAKIDKHSTGGVGDKVSLILAPLAVAAGLKVPMISGRGLGHTGGTLDKLESIPGFEVDVTTDDFKRFVRQVGGSIIGQTENIAPADKKLYALRDATGTVESIPLISSSIMSKKLAEGIDGLVLDVKVGSGAFIKERKRARKLGKTMIEIGDSMGCDVRAVVTDMNQPLGRAVGNAVEVAESIDTLKGEGPRDLEDVTLELVAHMLDVGGMATKGPDKLKPQLKELLNDGSALDVFRQMIDIQGGDPAVCEEPREAMETAEFETTFTAPRAGYISDMDAEQVGLAAMELGAGRETMDDEIDHSVGLVFNKKVGDRVESGETIVDIQYNDEKLLEACRRRLEDAIDVVERRVDTNPLIYERL
jgi:pyrimidine-nucleoside phosphorylase